MEMEERVEAEGRYGRGRVRDTHNLQEIMELLSA